MTIPVRLAGKDDLGAMAAIHAASFPTPWTAADIGSFSWATGGFALVSEALDGFVLVRVVADEADVLTLAVLPSARRRGVARTLLQAATAVVIELGASKLFLDVSTDNEAARALYVQEGFVEVGRRLNYYAQGADALSLVKALKA